MKVVEKFGKFYIGNYKYINYILVKRASEAIATMDPEELKTLTNMRTMRAQAELLKHRGIVWNIDSTYI